MSNLNEVKWQASGESGEYTKKIRSQKQIGDIEYKKIEVSRQIGLDLSTDKIHLFTRYTKENHGYSVGFFEDVKGQLIQKQFPAFCFFPTKEVTHLNFILHAPFLLTDSRESIKRFEEYNSRIVLDIAKLAADCILVLKDLKLINDDILKIIPYKIPDGDDFFGSFYELINEKFQTEEILPSKNGYIQF